MQQFGGFDLTLGPRHQANKSARDRARYKARRGSQFPQVAPQPTARRPPRGSPICVANASVAAGVDLPPLDLFLGVCGHFGHGKRQGKCPMYEEMCPKVGVQILGVHQGVPGTRLGFPALAPQENGDWQVCAHVCAQVCARGTGKRLLGD